MMGGTGILYTAFGLLREGLSQRVAFEQTSIRRWGSGGVGSWNQLSKHLGLSVAGRWMSKYIYSG